MFEFINFVNNILWDYLGFFLIIVVGLYFTFKSRFYQFTILKEAKRQLTEFYHLYNDSSAPGIHPFKLYFASIGGSIGLGNITVAGASIAIGGPGTIFWLWCASFFGSLLKYSEIYLGIVFREKNNSGGYDGGAFYYLKKAFPNSKLNIVSAFLLCLYGVEIYQFSFVTNNIAVTFNIWYPLVLFAMLSLTFYIAIGGINRLANINTFLMPMFLVIYILICIFIILLHWKSIPGILVAVFQSAFTGKAMFLGLFSHSILKCMHHGISTAVYSGDICIGYDSLVQAETALSDPTKQARFSVLSLFTDTFICTLSMLVVLCTGTWMFSGAADCGCTVTKALTLYVPYSEHFMSVLFFLTGFTTVMSYLTVGYRSAKYLSPRFGFLWFTVLAFTLFIFFSYYDQTVPLLIMTTIGGLLVLCNVIGIIKLRKEVKFL